MTITNIGNPSIIVSRDGTVYRRSQIWNEPLDKFVEIRPDDKLDFELNAYSFTSVSETIYELYCMSNDSLSAHYGLHAAQRIRRWITDNVWPRAA